jgi:hypothetical protein
MCEGERVEIETWKKNVNNVKEERVIKTTKSSNYYVLYNAFTCSSKVVVISI